LEGLALLGFLATGPEWRLIGIGSVIIFCRFFFKFLWGGRWWGLFGYFILKNLRKIIFGKILKCLLTLT